MKPEILTWPDWLSPRSLDDAQARATTIPDDALGDAMSAAVEARSTADGLVEAAEEKANNLLGFAGVLAGLEAGAIAFLAGRTPDPNHIHLFRFQLLLFVASLALVSWSIWYSVRVGRVGRFVTQHPDPDQGMAFDKGLNYGRRSKIAKDSYHAAWNYLVAQAKSDGIRRSQARLVASIALAVLGALLAGYSIWG